MKEGRNIIDHYWYWSQEAIKADLDKKRNDFAVLCCNWKNDFNIAGVVRNANAFLASMVWVYGRSKFDKRGTVGTHVYEHIRPFKRRDVLDRICKEYNVVAIDNIDGAVPIETFEWPPNTLMAFGQEQIGLEPDVLDRAKHLVYIKQYGSVRSLNVACASGICMYDWCAKNSTSK